MIAKLILVRMENVNWQKILQIVKQENALEPQNQFLQTMNAKIIKRDA